jgi:peptidyl-tRNA hydrolase, PTH1 family
MDRTMIVGLGNPGKKYENTRHNIGFMCMDAFANAYQIKLDGSQSKAKTGDGTVRGRRVLLVQPQTYMNESGVAVRALADFYKIEPDHILLIYDDLDTDLGTLRIRAKGGAGGQKGVKSTIQHLGTQDFPRIRFGIGRPPGKMDPAAYVLRPFDKDDAALVQETIHRVVQAIDLWLSDGIDTAMNRHNGTVEDAADAARQELASPPPSET